MQRRTLLSALAAAGATTAAPWALAQQAAWPDQPLRWVVPYPAGGGTDVLARTVAEAMRQTLGQQIIVDNRPGASTNIGGQAVATAKPDGYTFMSADNAILAYNEHLFTKLPFNPEKDFTYVGGISRFPLALVVHPAFEAKTVKEFLAYARANPGKLNYASPGNGSPHHLAMEMFKNRTKTFLTHIPYRGAAPALQDVMGGQVPCMFLDLAAGLPVITSGKVRALAIGSAKRVAALPDVPTLAEAGVPNTEVFAFQGILAPAGLPAAITARLNGDLNKALLNPAVVKRMNDFGMEALPGTPEQFRTMARAESKRWGEIIKAAGVKLD
ncbi:MULTISPECIES: tripartite tricarboxylate transporter substrate binding protein [unclassified Acidovorax]|jgi:tripartite-type tricarboxylate transporter receptor subunit TctC|uniref:Bug family tripartite tricarboxylate transporter substrate binding protein n=1 Tax=unclassified Acidovorax TaxID=2684926 RepID=UPI001C47BBAC|nr:MULTISPECIES: tripartite tricarboxylate transporter substrate binding protein [unclassified Acidovorax]MBV7458147.1 tripartite tricarboxylate transporter substrate binding protein [Acidovorax sp. sif0632]MBV7464031.1 tripartite tricarboxylate transporter substrate binding protein [Acidovorax sp. sif0613]